MTIERKTNGYDKWISEALINRLEQFEKAVETHLGLAVENVHEFFYGEKLVMIDIVLADRNYGRFNLTENRISFNGHTCTDAEHDVFSRLTLNDECHRGGLIKA